MLNYQRVSPFQILLLSYHHQGMRDKVDNVDKERAGIWTRHLDWDDPLGGIVHIHSVIVFLFNHRNGLIIPYDEHFFMGVKTTNQYIHWTKQKYVDLTNKNGDVSLKECSFMCLQTDHQKWSEWPERGVYQQQGMKTRAWTPRLSSSKQTLVEIKVAQW